MYRASFTRTKLRTWLAITQSSRFSNFAQSITRGRRGGKSGDLNQSYGRLGSFPKQDGRKTRDLSRRADFDGGSGEPTILHLLSHVIDPLFSTLEAIILTGVNIYRETEGERERKEGQVRERVGRVGRGRKSHANTSLRRPFGAADPPK